MKLHKITEADITGSISRDFGCIVDLALDDNTCWRGVDPSGTPMSGGGFGSLSIMATGKSVTFYGPGLYTSGVVAVGGGLTTVPAATDPASNPIYQETRWEIALDEPDAGCLLQSCGAALEIACRAYHAIRGRQTTATVTAVEVQPDGTVIGTLGTTSITVGDSSGTMYSGTTAFPTLNVSAPAVGNFVGLVVECDSAPAQNGVGFPQVATLDVDFESVVAV